MLVRGSQRRARRPVDRRHGHAADVHHVERLLQHVCAELAGLGRRVVGRSDRDVAVPVRRLVGGATAPRPCRRRARPSCTPAHRRPGCLRKTTQRCRRRRPSRRRRRWSPARPRRRFRGDSSYVQPYPRCYAPGNEPPERDDSGGAHRARRHLGHRSRRRSCSSSSALFLAAAVLAAVHHAEVVAHRVGEPFGSLVLAVAVTVIEVALIVTLMVSGGNEHRDARARHGVRGGDDHRPTASSGCRCCRRAAATRRDVQRRGHGDRARHGRHAGRLCLVLPTFTTSAPGPEFSRLAARVRRASRRSRSTGCSCSSRRSATATTSCPWPRRRGARRAADATARRDQPRCCCSSRWSPSSGWRRSSRRRSRTR